MLFHQLEVIPLVASSVHPLTVAAADNYQSDVFHIYLPLSKSERDMRKKGLVMDSNNYYGKMRKKLA